MTSPPQQRTRPLTFTAYVTEADWRLLAAAAGGLDFAGASTFARVAALLAADHVLAGKPLQAFGVSELLACGRHPSRPHSLGLRMTQEERAELRKAAGLLGCKMAPFAVAAALAVARKVIEPGDREATHLAPKARAF
jgi:uncharacterized protein (DUF1778 family)